MQGKKEKISYYNGVGVGAWSYGGNIIEGYSGDFPGGARRLYLTSGGNLYITGPIIPLP